MTFFSSQLSSVDGSSIGFLLKWSLSFEYFAALSFIEIFKGSSLSSYLVIRALYYR